MIPVFVGMLIVLGTLVLVGFGLVVAIAGSVTRRAGVVRAGATLAGLALLGWGVAWVAGYVASPSRVVPVGEELSFCSLDCHLHVSVVEARRNGGLAVTLRFRNDARREPEYPFHLDIVARDSAGRLYPPSSGLVAEPLGAGQTVEREFRFALAPDAGAPTLMVRYDGWMDYLVPGRGNALVQGRVRLGLGETPKA